MDETVEAGNNFTFTCTHPNATSISWEKDGATLSNSAGFLINDLSPGSTTLELVGVTVEVHNGSYACVVQLSGASAEMEREPFVVNIACKQFVDGSIVVVVVVVAVRGGVARVKALGLGLSLPHC